MSNWEQYLTNEDIRNLSNAIIDAGHATQEMLPLLKQDIPARYKGTLGAAGMAPNLALKFQLKQMNKVQSLITGQVPLELFLTTLLDVDESSQYVPIYENALKKVEAGGVANAAQNARVATALEEELNTSVANTLFSDPSLGFETEATIGGFDETVEVGFLRGGSHAAQSVFKIIVHRHFDEMPEYINDTKPRLSNGTGWMIGPGLGITNFHVFNARSEIFGEADASDADYEKQCETARIIFDYYDSDDSNLTETSLGAATLLASDKTLDYAIFRIPETAPRRPPLQLRTRKISKTLTQKINTRVNVLQHPGGKPMKLGFRSNFVILGNDQILTYLTDTAKGSSGSPVCDDDWKVAALHFGSKTISGNNIKIGEKLIRRENTGTPMPTIMANLDADLAAEIVAGQHP